MGVYIPNAKMPSCCALCTIRYQIGCLPPTKMGSITYRGRMESCPLIEIKTPHGRLIDADELKKKKYHSDITHENAVAVAEIDWLPTVIKAEE